MPVLSGQIYDFQPEGSSGKKREGGSDSDLPAKRGSGKPLHHHEQNRAGGGKHYSGADCGHQCGYSGQSPASQSGDGGYWRGNLGYCRLYGRKCYGIYNADRGR